MVPLQKFTAPASPGGWLREAPKPVSSTRDLNISLHWEKFKEKLYFMLFQIKTKPNNKKTPPTSLVLFSHFVF